MMEQNRSQDIQDQSDYFGKMATFTQEPDGMLGLLAQHLNGWIDRVKVPAFKKVNGKWQKSGESTIRPIKFAIPFVNIVANVGNSALDFTPWGIVRARVGGGHVFSGKQQDLNKDQRWEQAISGMIGSTAMAFVYGMASRYLDDEDPYFAISAMGPDDADKRRQMMSQGWRPFTMKIGDTYIKYNETPLAIPFSIAGAVFDDKRYGKGEDRSVIEKANLFAIYGARALSEAGFLSSIKDVMDMTTGSTGVTGVTKGILSLPARTAKGLIPGQGFLRDMVTRIIDPEIIQNDSIWASFIRDIPFAQKFGTKPMLNAFGEPVKRSTLDRVPLASRFGSSRTDDPAWNYLAKHGFWLPGMGSRITVSGGSKGALRRIKEKRAENLGRVASEVFTEAEAYEYVKRVGAEQRKLVERFAERFPEPDERRKEYIQNEIKREVSSIRSRVRERMVFESVR